MCVGGGGLNVFWSSLRVAIIISFFCRTGPMTLLCACTSKHVWELGDKNLNIVGNWPTHVLAICMIERKISTKFYKM